MSTRIPEEKIEEIRKSSDIVDVISQFVQLKKQGKQYTGLCPFHGEKSPSFSVSPEKQVYHCFGCGAGGNVFTFLRDHEGYSFTDSVKYLADKGGIDLPEAMHQSSESRSSNHQFAEMLRGHEEAATFYQRVFAFTEEGNAGREYASQRGFTNEQLTHFQIGFAPNGWENLATFLTKKNFTEASLVQAGLVAERDQSEGVYDRFRNRLMFPIWDSQGKVVGFSGRLVGEGKPKYLNSPDTPIFHKNKLLYGLHLARASIRKKNIAVLLEGAADVVAAWGAGVDNGVATLGTALTEEHAKILRRNAEHILICYDSDSAGQSAAFRSASLLEKAGCTVSITTMPEGYDPDDYIKAFGAERFNSDVIGSGQTVMAFKMKYLRQEKNLRDEGERMSYIEEVLEELAALPRAIERDYYLRQLADEFSLSLDVLKQEQYRMYRETKTIHPAKEATQVSNVSERRQVRQKRLLPAYQNAERILLVLMMENEDLAWRIQEQLGSAFNVDEHQALFAYLLAYYGKGNEANPKEFLQSIEDASLVRLASELSTMTVNVECSEEELEDYIKLIQDYPKRVEIQQKQAELKLEHDPITQARLLIEIQHLKRELS
ncbi:DNA primase [Alkalicoccobacillus porphyridii]|uniref:DNA primase n=1 Tax=Alkalicoccobacillus porphyridii TaxID=2597270 RepID=A0A553ZZ71_9BACI|nr:DNA primase [Alkalicoccobacillus porphyridii]TSB46748.1 DNA primase [Alkalicoccobacillus porphyridii]